MLPVSSTPATCFWLLLGVMLTACAGSVEQEEAGGAASVTIAGRTFEVDKVHLILETGEDGYFRIAGDDAANPDEDCVPGVAGVLALYGDLPSSITSVADLAGKKLPFEFSGDGDDANLCFVGSNGLLGVETGTVQFTAVEGRTVTFTFSGSFMVYDGEGGESGPIDASGGGTAVAAR